MLTVDTVQFDLNEAYIVQQFGGYIWGNCAILATSMKFSPVIVLHLLKKIGYGPIEKIQNGRHFQDGRHSIIVQGTCGKNWPNPKQIATVLISFV